MCGWSVLGSVLLMGSVSLLVSPHGSLDRLKKLICIISLKRILKDRHNRARHGSAGKRRVEQVVLPGSEMWGVLLVPSSSPTLPPIYDGFDVNVTSNITWFHLSHDMVSRRIYKLSFYGGHSIILGHPEYLWMQITWQPKDSPGNQRMSTKHPALERGSKMRLFETNKN